jgi:hypothetical protein
MGQQGAPRHDRRSEALARTDPNWPDTGTYTAHTTSMTELFGQEGLICNTISCEIITLTAV